MSPRLRAQYPEEMTIVLQHQFWDLIVTEDGFEVGLSFGGVPERLCVPFAAIKGFFDPSVQFGLQFEQVDAAERRAPATPEAAAGTAPCRAAPQSRRGRRRSTRRAPGRRSPLSRRPANPPAGAPARAGAGQARRAARSCGSTASARNRAKANREQRMETPRHRYSPFAVRRRR